ncbi:MAG: DUF4249 family protein [Bacteroidota bacterium]
MKKITFTFLLAGLFCLISCTTDLTDELTPDFEAEPVLNMILEPGEPARARLTRSYSVTGIEDTTEDVQAIINLVIDGSITRELVYQGNQTYSTLDSTQAIEHGMSIQTFALTGDGDSLWAPAIEIPSSFGNLTQRSQASDTQENFRQFEAHWRNTSSFYRVTINYWFEGESSQSGDLLFNTNEPENLANCPNCEIALDDDIHSFQVSLNTRFFDVPTQAFQIADSMSFDLTVLTEAMYRFEQASSGFDGFESLFLYPQSPYSNVEGGWGIIGAVHDTTFTASW